MGLTALETEKKIASDLHTLGVAPGETVLVHSSLRSLGKMEGGAETVIRGLLRALGVEGTLLFPALSFRDVTMENPYFDVRNTPCCIGALPEYFRTRENTLRSIHPTHSVSGTGRLAPMLLADHELDETSCGKNSPFRKLREQKSWILFIGCGIASNTSMHAVEELVDPPYLHGKKVAYQCTLQDGSVREMRVHRHNFQGYLQNYKRVGEILSGNELRQGPVLEAQCHLMRVDVMWEKALACLKKDPFHFVLKRDS